MLSFPKQHYLRGLRELDVENLACGRITSVTMEEACNRAEEATKLNPMLNWHILVADELNDMLEAAKQCL